MQPLRIPSNSSTSPPPSPRLQEHPKDEAMERVDQVAQDSLIRTETPTLSPIVEGVEQRRLSADSLAILFEQQLQLQWVLKRNEIQAHENMLTGIELFDPANPGSIGAILPKFHIFHRGKLSLLILEILLNQQWTDPRDPCLVALRTLNQKDPKGIAIFAKAIWSHPQFGFELYGNVIDRVAPLLKQNPLHNAVIDFIQCGLRWDDSYSPAQQDFVDQFFRAFFTETTIRSQMLQNLGRFPTACLKIIESATRLKAAGEAPYGVAYVELLTNCFYTTVKTQTSFFDTLVWALRSLLETRPYCVALMLCLEEFSNEALYPLLVEVLDACSISQIFKICAYDKNYGSRAVELLLDSVFEHGGCLFEQPNPVNLLQRVLSRIESSYEHLFTQTRRDIVTQWISKCPAQDQETCLLKSVLFADFPNFWTAYRGREEVLTPDCPQFNFFRSIVVEWPHLRLPDSVTPPSQAVFQNAALFEQTLLACQFPRVFHMPSLNLDNLLVEMEAIPGRFSCNLWIIHQHRYNKEVASSLSQMLPVFLPLLVDGAEALNLPPQAELIRLNQGLRILAATLAFEQSYEKVVIYSFQRLICNALAMLRESAWTKYEANQLLLSLGEIARKAPCLFAPSADDNTRDELELSQPLNIAYSSPVTPQECLELVGAMYHIYKANPELFQGWHALKGLVSKLHQKNQSFFIKAFKL